MAIGHPFSLGNRLAVVMVGLPARGKTYTARKLARYLSWLGYRAQVFNVGNYRRQAVGSQVHHSFFDPDNTSGVAARRKVATAAMDDMTEWMNSGGEIGIYDATNTTRHRREWVTEHCSRHGIDVLFIELICDTPDVIEANIKETKLTAPDYAEVKADEATADFRARIDHYVQAYQPIVSEMVPFVKLIDMGRKVVTNRIEGYLMGRIVHYVMNLHPGIRPIWLTRHGQSQSNVRGQIGGDEPLSGVGHQFSLNLASFITELDPQKLVVWTSSLQRTVSTAKALNYPSVSLRSLDEIDAGICDSMTYAQIEERMPEDFAARAEDKLRYRYPRGESYEDVIQRVEPVLIELERRTDPTLVIAHQAVLRALVAYFTAQPRERCPRLEIPLHTVIELTPKAYGCLEQRHRLGPDVLH